MPTVTARCWAIYALFALVAVRTLAAPPGTLSIDYPANGTLFPPDFAAPLFQWRDSTAATTWTVEVKFGQRAKAIQVQPVEGQPMHAGEIDPECVSEFNELPRLTPEQAAAHTWRPDEATWRKIKEHSIRQPATVVISGFEAGSKAPVSTGSIVIRTSEDPVDAPIFYRDVPLIPGVGERGEVRPLPPSAIRLIQWRLRYVEDSRSTVLMKGLPTCANCHSFPRDGKTLAMDVDGPSNDKGLYSLTPIQAHTAIRNENIVQWSRYRPLERSANIRVGFMSQVSPNGRYVVTMINDPGPNKGGPGLRPQERVFVANFKDYRFGQVFYPTRGILAVYDRDKQALKPLPGADNPRFVHTGAFWSPDGKYLVFSRAAAMEPFPEGYKQPAYANDPNETQIQYDLYRIPFNDGRGGTAEPIRGASANGKSNSFAKVSPDGKWIVFVQCRNGQLMRPDSELYIVPFEGGDARRLDSNTPRMNSWHSFSPNGRWLVFASKSPSPYTQMYLTHIDERGMDSPPLLIENATAANRAINIPEFLDIPKGGLMSMSAPVTDFYSAWERAADVEKGGDAGKTTEAWAKLVELDGGDARARVLYGQALDRDGRFDDAIVQYRRAIELDPEYALAHNNLGFDLAQKGRVQEAIPLWQRAIALDPGNVRAHSNLGMALMQAGRIEEAVEHSRRSVELAPDDAVARGVLGVALARTGGLVEAAVHLEKAAALQPGSVAFLFNLARVYAASRRFDNAIAPLEKASEFTGGKDLDILELLAAMYGETGRLDKAVDTGRAALAVAQRAGDPRRAAEIADQLRAFEMKRARPQRTRNGDDL